MPIQLSKRTLVSVIILVLVIPAGLWIALYAGGKIPAPGDPVAGSFNMSDRIATLEVDDESGKLEFVFSDFFGGHEGRMSPEEFAEEIKLRKTGLPPVFRWLDVTGWTGLLWVLFGLLGQAVFMGRLIIQWRASEKARSSVVPPLFWWFSLIGSSMLLIYFIWRKEPVGFLGQSTGWFIYVRNLWFIHGQPTKTQAEEK